MSISPYTVISIPPDAPEWEGLLNLLQAGFYLDAEVGVSAREFIREALGFEDAYIEGRISTVFLDSEPVDDIDAAIVRDGSRLALSAAMPGLVGAVMRRKSFYAAFREGISHGHRAAEDPSPAEIEGAGASEPRRGRVLVKLFNSIMDERGRGVLERGVILEGGELARALAGSAESRTDETPHSLVALKVESIAPRSN